MTFSLTFIFVTDVLCLCLLLPKLFHFVFILHMMWRGSLLSGWDAEDSVMKSLPVGTTGAILVCFGLGFFCLFFPFCQLIVLPVPLSSSSPFTLSLVSQPSACSVHVNLFFVIHLEHRLVGIVVRRLPREQKIPGSNPACVGIFSGLSHTSDLKIGTSLATLPGAWRYRISAGTGWPGVSIL